VESIVGFDRLVHLWGTPMARTYSPPSGVRVEFDSRSHLLTLEDLKGGHWNFALDSLIAARLASGQTATGPMDAAVRLESVSGTSRARLLLRELSGLQQADTVAVQQLEADVLLEK
jgi:hypothetical protein